MEGGGMKDPVQHYWQLRLQVVKERLVANNFAAVVVDTAAAAARAVCDDLLPSSGARVVSYGGSMTLKATGLHDFLNRADCGYEVIRPDAPGIAAGEKLERRRRALLADVYCSGVNAVTEAGHVVNLDMIGNRAAAITFGPKDVILLAGRNKIVPDLEAAMLRIKNYAAPANAMRLDCKTPCVQTARCADCRSPGRICNSWTITEKSYPKGRITVVLINADLGL
jgi:hypothetical protein